MAGFSYDDELADEMNEIMDAIENDGSAPPFYGDDDVPDVAAAAAAAAQAEADSVRAGAMREELARVRNGLAVAVATAAGADTKRVVGTLKELVAAFKPAEADAWFAANASWVAAMFNGAGWDPAASPFGKALPGTDAPTAARVLQLADELTGWAGAVSEGAAQEAAAQGRFAGKGVVGGGGGGGVGVGGRIDGGSSTRLSATAAEFVDLSANATEFVPSTLR